MDISYLRSPVGSGWAARRAHRRLTTGNASRGNGGRWLAGAALVLVVAVLAGLAVAFTGSKATLTTDPSALARVGLPLGGGTITNVTVVHGPNAARIATVLESDRVYPTDKIPAGERIEIDVTVRRPGWVSWLTGASERLKLFVTTPVASLSSHYLTLAGSHAPLTVTFQQPVRTIAYGVPGHMFRRTLPTPQSRVALPRPAVAGTEYVAATVRTWERANAAAVSWFPAGRTATAVANPAFGSQITPDTPITLTFSKPISDVLGANLPPVSPSGAGSWQRTGSHTITFVPSGYGFGLGAHVTVGLPSGVRLAGGSASARWSVPGGSTIRLQQLLSMLGYLPFKFHYAQGGVPNTATAQESAAVNPPAGQFDWAYPDVPSGLHGMWAPGTFGTMTRGALMAFENDSGMAPDGVAGPAVWKALIDDVVAGKGVSSFGYTYVMVRMGSPETLRLWHNGKFLFKTLVNTGVPAAPTAAGTYPVFEHLPVTTMTGTNPDGSHYSDPGIPWVSYFNGGDALHGFIRGGYGYPQSDGCVEMTYDAAHTVYPYTPIGTLVNVT